MKLADKLIALRKDNGWSQEDFAEKLDVSRQAISRWENGTALPDAQNILRISKMFNVSADYLLNDDYEDEKASLAVETAGLESKSLVRKKKNFYGDLIVAICVILLSVCAIFEVVRYTNRAHVHPALSRVIENEVRATCTVQGAYDEVLYCVECGEEVMRTHITAGIPSHQFQDEKCIVCGEEQRARG